MRSCCRGRAAAPAAGQRQAEALLDLIRGEVLAELRRSGVHPGADALMLPLGALRLGAGADDPRLRARALHAARERFAAGVRQVRELAPDAAAAPDLVPGLDELERPLLWLHLTVIAPAAQAARLAEAWELDRLDPARCRERWPDLDAGAVQQPAGVTN